jgi:phosphate-selective porin OprO/OprP
MERAMIVELLAPSRAVGVMATNHTENERATFSAGAFATEDGPRVRSDDQATSFTARATWLPWYDEATEGRGLLHTGVAWTYRNAFEDTFGLSARPEAHLSQRIVDIDVLGVEHINTLGLEAAFVYGPFSVQSEYISGWLSPIGGGDEYNVDGFYVYASYFLTGENRRYKTTSGCFDRVKPYENFFHVCTCDGRRATGKGAWEVAYRYSHMDLDDDAILNGYYGTHTLGLNWYLNPYTRMMLNYVHLDMDPHSADFPGKSQQDAFQMRAQIDF